MTILDWLRPLIRAVTTGLLVVTAATVAEVLGPFWGALIASRPVSAGPAYVFMALRHGPGFIAESALQSAVANAATGLFLIAYALVAPRMPPWRGLCARVALWLVACLVARQCAWALTSAAAVNLAVFAVGFRVLPVPVAPAYGGTSGVVGVGRDGLVPC